jgi:hypothetical protein
MMGDYEVLRRQIQVSFLLYLGQDFPSENYEFLSETENRISPAFVLQIEMKRAPEKSFSRGLFALVVPHRLSEFIIAQL